MIMDATFSKSAVVKLDLDILFHKIGFKVFVSSVGRFKVWRESFCEMGKR